MSILLALEAHRRDPKPETEQAVLNALGSSPLPNFVSRLPALNQPTDPCGLIAISSDRFTEFGTVDGVLVTRDTQSGAITEHGPASFECGRWIGSDALDRRVEVSADGMHIRTGPLEGTWEVEKTFGEPLSLINRSFPASGLLAFYTAPDGVDSVIVLNEATLEQVGPTQSEGDYLLSVTLDRSGSRLALGWVSIGAPDGDGLTVVVDVRTGEELLRITTLEPARGLAFDEEAEQLVAGLVRGTFVTIDLATGEVVAEASSSMTHPVEIAVNEDGGIVAASAGQVLTLDRTTGSVGPSIDLIDVNESLIRADGSVLNISSDTELSVVDLAGSALVETAWPIEPSAFVLMRDGVAGVAAPREDIGAYTIDLATGDRRALALSREDGTPFFTEVIFPIAGSIWAFEFSAGRVEFHRWEDGSLRETVAWGLEGIRGNDQGEWLAGFGRAADGSERAQVFSFTEGRVTVSVPAQDTVSAHPTPDGGMHLLRADGMVLSYDNAGHLVNEINTYPDKPEDVFFTDLFVDPTSGDIAINTVGAGVLVVDTSTEQVVALTDFRNVAYMDFARNGELLVVSERDGTVRLWNLESGTSGGLVWDGTGDAKSVPWYDEATESVWVATSGWLLQVPLDPQQWIDRACEIVGRDMTQQEWDRFVPRGGPVQSACG